jgi:hypothetical protein
LFLGFRHRNRMVVVYDFWRLIERNIYVWNEKGDRL